mgnify:CR=1 FL=1
MEMINSTKKLQLSEILDILKMDNLSLIVSIRLESGSGLRLHVRNIVLIKIFICGHLCLKYENLKIPDIRLL